MARFLLHSTTQGAHSAHSPSNSHEAQAPVLRGAAHHSPPSFPWRTKQHVEYCHLRWRHTQRHEGVLATLFVHFHNTRGACSAFAKPFTQSTGPGAPWRSPLPPSPLALARETAYGTLPSAAATHPTPWGRPQHMGHIQRIRPAIRTKDGLRCSVAQRTTPFTNLRHTKKNVDMAICDGDRPNALGTCLLHVFCTPPHTGRIQRIR